MSEDNTTSGTQSKSLLAAVLEIARTYVVFPCYWKLEANGGLKKPPHEGCSWKTATRDPEIITEWWTRWPDALPGVPCGAVNWIFALDIDPRHGGWETLRKLEERYYPLPRTLTHKSCRQGEHRIYIYDAGLTSGVGKLGPGLDIISDGYYVIFPPGEIPGFGAYEVTHASPPLTTAPWLLDLVSGRTPLTQEHLGLVIPGRKSVGKAQYQGGDVPDGMRDSMLTSVAGSLRRRGFDEEAMFTSLSNFNQRRCKPPKDVDDIRRIAHSIAKKPIGEIEGPPLTEFGNSLRIIEQHGDDMRYSFQGRKWFVWDERRWAIDDVGQVNTWAKETINAIKDEEHQLYTLGQVDEARKLSKWAYQSQSKRHVENALWLARDELAILMDEMDTDDWLLNVENGTIDLRTGQLREHRREDLITRVSPVVYDPQATAPRFTQFLEEIHMGDQDIIGFMKRLMGYCLTGDISEQIFVLLLGDGGNGKTTFMELMMALLGDYAKPMEFRTLLHRKNEDKVRNDIAALFNTRMVKAVEAEEGERLNESLVKEMTGGDTITARFLFRELFDFKLKCKILLVANHKPEVRGVDRAIWRRVVLVPYDFTVPLEKMDRQLVEKLKEELPGVLNIALAGCREWQSQGIMLPPKIVAATQEYRQGQNRVLPFISSECDITDRGAYESAGALQMAYRQFCSDNGEVSLTDKEFAAALEGLGYKKIGQRLVRGKKQLVRIGIKLKNFERVNEVF